MKYMRYASSLVSLLSVFTCLPHLGATVVSVTAWCKNDGHSDRLAVVIGDSQNFHRQIDAEHFTLMRGFLDTIAGGSAPMHVIIEGALPPFEHIAQYSQHPEIFPMHTALQCSARQVPVRGNLTQTLSNIGGEYAGDLSNLFSILENSRLLAQASEAMLGDGLAAACEINDPADYAKARGANLEEFDQFLHNFYGMQDKFFSGPWVEMKHLICSQSRGINALTFLADTKKAIGNLEHFVAMRHADIREQQLLQGYVDRLKTAHAKAQQFFLGAFNGNLKRPCIDALLASIESTRSFKGLLVLNTEWLHTLVFDLNEAGYLMELLDTAKPQKVIIFLDTYSALSLNMHLEMLGFHKHGQSGLEDAAINGFIMPNERWSLTTPQLGKLLEQVLYNRFPVGSSPGVLHSLRQWMWDDKA